MRSFLDEQPFNLLTIPELCDLKLEKYNINELNGFIKNGEKRLLIIEKRLVVLEKKRKKDDYILLNQFYHQLKTKIEQAKKMHTKFLGE